MKNEMEAKKSNKEKVYERIDEKTQVISRPTTVHRTVTFVENGFPEELFNQWRKHCKAQFNDIYWTKIWSDHLKAQAYDLIIAGGVQYVNSAEQTPDVKETESSEPVVFGDGE
jgi:hypothetical protein